MFLSFVFLSSLRITRNKDKIRVFGVHELTLEKLVVSLRAEWTDGGTYVLTYIYTSINEIRLRKIIKRKRKMFNIYEFHVLYYKTIRI